MPKFLTRASFTSEGAKGLLKEGGTARRAAVVKMVEGLGGKVEAFYYAYGDDDAYIISDLPDATSGLAVSLAVNASGEAHVAGDTALHRRAYADAEAAIEQIAEEAERKIVLQTFEHIPAP